MSWIKRISKIYRKYWTKFKKIYICRIWLETIPKILNITCSQIKIRINHYKCRTVAWLFLNCLCRNRKEKKILADIKFYRTPGIERKFQKYRRLSAIKKTLVLARLLKAWASGTCTALPWLRPPAGRAGGTAVVDPFGTAMVVLVVAVGRCSRQRGEGWQRPPHRWVECSGVRCFTVPYPDLLVRILLLVHHHRSEIERRSWSWLHVGAV
jgi:hypothetical protein